MQKTAKTFTGVVLSDKTDKTIVVSVAARKTHPLYKKQYTANRKFMAHDEKNEAHTGDHVVISESKPISARKRFVLTSVTERAPVKHVEDVDEKIAEVSGQKPKDEVDKPETETKKSKTEKDK